MFADVAELREFYTSPLGQLAQRALRRKIRDYWPDLRGQRVLTLGYGTPIMRPILGEAERVLAFMPGAQGVIHWPSEGPNCTALIDEMALPLLDASVDRVILLHALESAPQLDPLLEEVWRVLTSGGRLLVIAPNRSGLWALSDATPFGHGEAFSPRQLKALLRRHAFIPENQSRALFFPPYQASFWRTLAPMLERTGPRWLGPLAGVHIIEGAKQLFALTGKRALSKRYVPALVRPSPASLRVR